VNLARFDALNWMASEKPIWFIPKHLPKIPHTPLITPAQARSLDRLDRLAMQAGLVGYDHSIMFGSQSR
jgi:hypothetical protein